MVMSRLLPFLVGSHLWWSAHGIWIAATFIASSFSVGGPANPAFEIPHLDKVMHFAWFMIGGFVLTTAILFNQSEVNSRWWKIVFPVLFMVAFGAFDEFRQSFTPGRNGNDLGDWLADSFGGIGGVWLANCVVLVFRRKIAQLIESRTAR